MGLANFIAHGACPGADDRRHRTRFEGGIQLTRMADNGGGVSAPPLPASLNAHTHGSPGSTYASGHTIRWGRASCQHNFVTHFRTDFPRAKCLPLEVFGSRPLQDLDGEAGEGSHGRACGPEEIRDTRLITNAVPKERFLLDRLKAHRTGRGTDAEWNPAAVVGTEEPVC